MLAKRTSAKRAPAQKDPIEGISDANHKWLKATFNELVQFECFAIAELSLPGTIMMPMMLLPDIDTKTESAVRIAANIDSATHSCAVYLNPGQTDDVLGDYLKATLEQAREGEMLPRTSANRYETIRMDCKYFERSLDILDINRTYGTTVALDIKDKFYRRYHAISSDWESNSIESREYFKDSLAMARKYRDNWKMIL